MEARLMADLAYSFEKKLTWGDCFVTGRSKDIILGRKAIPTKELTLYNDYISRASEGWQNLRAVNQQ